MKLSELLEIRDIASLKAKHIFYIVVAFYLIAVLYFYWQFINFGTLDGYEPNHIMRLLFAPIYEEVLFRGIILVGLLKIFQNKTTVIIWSGILFGIWHLKNFPFMELNFSVYGVYRQVVYTVFLGCLFTWIALKYKTIWTGVILHFINNIFLHPLSLILLALSQRFL